MLRDEFIDVAEQERSRLIRVAEKYVGNAAADDIVQDALVRALGLGDLDALAGADDAVTWLERVVRNAAKNALRDAGRAREREEAYAAENGPVRADRPRDLDLERGLAVLPVTLREPVELVIGQDYTVREAAGLLGVPVMTAQDRIQAGIRRLRTNGASAGLGKCGDQEEQPERGLIPTRDDEGAYKRRRAQYIRGKAPILTDDGQWQLAPAEGQLVPLKLHCHFGQAGSPHECCGGYHLGSAIYGPSYAATGASADGSGDFFYPNAAVSRRVHATPGGAA